MKLLFSLAVSFLFLYLALRGLDLKEIGRSLLHVNPLLLGLAMGVHLSSFWIRSVRWRTMLRPIKQISARRLFPTLAISYLANNTLPMRAGEFIRAYLLGKNEEISKTSSFSTILLERIFDGLTLLMMLGGVAALIELPTWARNAGFLAGMAFAGVTVLMIGLVFSRTWTLMLVHRLLSYFPGSIADRVEGFLHRFVSGLDILQSLRGLLAVFFWSMIIWALEAAALFMVAMACGQSLPVLGAFFTLVIINLGTMIPSSPGYVGTFEFFCVKSLAMFGIVEAGAMGFALILHVVQFVPITLVGLYFFVRQGISMRSMTLQKGLVG